jgi:signal transduction histidine kinase
LPIFFYARLIGFTAGTLLYLFLVALILGSRRPRRFERLPFFLMLSLFLIYAAGLLEINAGIQYPTPPELTRFMHVALFVLGVLVLLPMVPHAYFEYGRQAGFGALSRRAVGVLAISYTLPAAAVAWAAYVSSTRTASGLYVTHVAQNLLPVAAFLSTACAFAFFRKAKKETTDQRLFLWLFGLSGLLTLLALGSCNFFRMPTETKDAIVTGLVLAGVLPGAVIAYFALRRNFLEFGAQRNLVYALSATFLALLYFALVRRVSGWLEAVLPPEATAAILIFVLVFLFEPLERAIGPALNRRFRERLGALQVLSGELREQARHGDEAKLLALAERRVRKQFGLAEVRISVRGDAKAAALESPGAPGHTVRVPLLKDRKEIGVIEAVSTGSYLTGETSAALEFLAEQLPAMIDLCRLIEEKLRLERELAERERLALLGQMAASVSHNLRNPLSSMKTVLQVQLENPELPLDVRHDCALVVDEIDRMSAKLAQLLRFAKPSVNGQRVGAVALAKQTAALFGRDAERRNVRLELACPSSEVYVLASEEALSEVLSNLIVNGIEAQPNGGRLRVGIALHGDRLELEVEDDGPGISPELRAKIFEPYFTTKATGTGLGLSIVTRRTAEMGGTMACESPVRGGKGTRFRLTLPAAVENGR